MIYKVTFTKPLTKPTDQTKRQNLTELSELSVPRL